MKNKSATIFSPTKRPVMNAEKNDTLVVTGVEITTGAGLTTVVAMVYLQKRRYLPPNIVSYFIKKSRAGRNGLPFRFFVFNRLFFSQPPRVKSRSGDRRSGTK